MTVRIIIGDTRDKLRALPSDSVDCCVTSPPYYGLRDYGVAGQIGLEETPDAYISELVGVFREVRRVLKPTGTLWLNLGDSYAGANGSGSQGVTGQRASRTFTASTIPKLGKPKDLLMIPARVALALQSDGWWLRSEIIWAKPNPMPESVTDRPTSAHEKIYLLAKSERYFFDSDAVAEPAIYHGLTGQDPSGFKNPENFNGKHKDGYRSNRSDKQRGHGRRHQGFNERWDAMERAEQCSGMRNIRNVWTIATQPFSEAHFATFPPSLIEPCIKAGSPKGGTVLDPFGGAGTTGLVADRFERNAILIELNPEYAVMAERRIRGDAPMFASVEAA